MQLDFSEGIPLPYGKAGCPFSISKNEASLCAVDRTSKLSNTDGVTGGAGRKGHKTGTAEIHVILGHRVKNSLLAGWLHAVASSTRLKTPLGRMAGKPRKMASFLFKISLTRIYSFRSAPLCPIFARISAGPGLHAPAEKIRQRAKHEPAHRSRPGEHRVLVLHP